MNCSQVDYVLSEIMAFESAAEAVRRNKSLTTDQQLSLYGLFKQATDGDIASKRPGLLDFSGAAKW